MSYLLKIKKGDTARSLTDTLSYNDGSAVDLTGATVELNWDVDGTKTSRTNITVVDATNGVVSYQFTSADVASVCRVLLEWKITFPDTTVLYVPTKGFIKLDIEDNIDE